KPVHRGATPRFRSLSNFPLLACTHSGLLTHLRSVHPGQGCCAFLPHRCFLPRRHSPRRPRPLCTSPRTKSRIVDSIPHTEPRTFDVSRLWYACQRPSGVHCCGGRPIALASCLMSLKVKRRL